MTARLALAVTAGMLAAFNPCGFALLPGYLALFLARQPPGRPFLARALVVSAAVTAGFVAVFGGIGVAFAVLSLSLGPWVSYLALAAGLVLLVMGVMLLTGRDLSFGMPRARLLADGSPTGMVAYGVVYATVSLSCTLPVFLAAVVSGLTDPWISLATALAYAGGMGLVLATLAVVVGALGDLTVRRARPWTRLVGRVAGVLVLAAAAYTIWYSWVEIRSFHGAVQTTPPLLTSAADLSARVSRVVADVGAWRVLAVLLVVVAVAAAARTTRRRR